MGEIIRWETDGNIGFIILDDPPKNMMTAPFFLQLHDIVTNIENTGVGAVVLYGSGRHFSQGADLQDLLQNIQSNVVLDESGSINHYPPFLNQNVHTFLSLRQLKIPVIAAIRGVCLGSAFELALSCHLRICATNSVFALPEATFNLLPGCGGIQFLTSLLGKATTLQLVLHGNNFSAEEAYSLGIVDYIYEKNDVLPRAVSFAEELIKKGSGVPIQHD